MSLSKEDYYATPGAELGDSSSKATTSAEVEEVDLDEDEDDIEEEQDEDKSAPDLSQEEIAALSKVANDTKPEATKQTSTEADSFELEIADDSPLTDDDIQDLVSFAERKGLSKEETIAELTNRERLLKRGLTASESQAYDAIKAFEQEVKDHPLFATHEIRQETERAVNTALDRFFDPAFKERFDKVYSKDVYLQTALYKLGRPFMAGSMPGKPVSPIAPTSVEDSEEARLKRLYPENFK
jgi:hypothetical protein